MSSIASPMSNCSKKHHDAPMTKRDIYFGLDCEMVGVGEGGLTSAVGRVSVVNWENQTVLDTYVQVPGPVTDYRTHVSGITPELLQPSDDPNHQLMTFSEVRTLVQTILRGKILIGHGLENDLKVLGMYHPWSDIRDTATYSIFMRDYCDPVTQQMTLAPKKLRDLTWELLGRQIQCPGMAHSPTEDAIAALDLYKKVRGQWEDHLAKLSQLQEKEQQEQLMERQQQLLLERQEQQRQLQQARRWQWLASNNSGPASGAAGQAYPSMMHPVMQAAPPGPLAFNGPTPPIMAMTASSPSPAASAFLQQLGPSTPQQANNTRSSSSSWFGFSRRSKSRGGLQETQQPSQQQMPPQQQQQQQPSNRRDFNRQASRDSIATQCTLAMTNASFETEHEHDSSPQTLSSISQDCEGLPSSPRGAWHVPHDFGFEEEVDIDQIQEEERDRGMLDSLVLNLSADYSEPCTDATETEISETDAEEVDAPEFELPKDYEPPRYFANSEPQGERLSSSSWFKLWGSSRKQEDSTSKSCGYNSDAEMDENSEKPNRIFSKRIFPRRASENCMSGDYDQKCDSCSKSMHGF